MSLLAGGASLIGGLSGLFGNNNMPTYSPTFGPGAIQGSANAAQTGIQNLNPGIGWSNAITGMWAPQLASYGNLATAQSTNPYIGQAVQGAASAAGYAPGLANLQYGTGTGLVGQGMSQIPYLQQTLQTAFDPQNALYNQLLSQTQNQQNVQNAQSGVANTPYGASLADLNLQNFNIGWQNNLLNRMQTGAQTAGQLGSNITGLTGAGLNYAGMAPQTTASLAGLPYQAYTGTLQNSFNALDQLTGAFTGAQGSALSGINASNVPVNDYLALLAGQTGANNQAVNAFNAQLGAQQQQFAQNQAYGSQIGAGLYGIGKGLGSIGSSFMPALGALG